VEWATPALPSTVAGYLGRLDSSDRADRICHGLGASTPYVLSGEEYKQVQTLWADEYPAYLSLHRKFNAARRRSGRARQCASVSLWRSAEITPEEQKWQGMKPEVQVDRSCLFFAVSILFFWSFHLLFCMVHPLPCMFILPTSVHVSGTRGSSMPGPSFERPDLN
jgi:hypothetical protein